MQFDHGTDKGQCMEIDEALSDNRSNEIVSYDSLDILEVESQSGNGMDEGSQQNVSKSFDNSRVCWLSYYQLYR